MRTFFIAVLLLSVQFAFAQIDVTFPQSRSVFQRNNANNAPLYIAGNYTQSIDKVEARLVPLQGGISIDWTTIQATIKSGTYQGTLATVSGGWYRLDIRASLNGQVIGTVSVDKVGIGEVFVIAGQSNAQGFDYKALAGKTTDLYSGYPTTDYQNVGAKDDRVNCISNYFTGYYNPQEIPYPIISQLSTHVVISPFGQGSWCWGSLGDLLVQRLNVPVLFMNAGWEGTPIAQWKQSSDGMSIANVYSGNPFPLGYPYANLKNSLQVYASLFGLRTVLWHQGETDNDIKTDAQTYRDNLGYVINKTRLQTGKNISWVLAHVSRTVNGTYQPVIDGQNLTIQQVSNVFAGPNTDVFTNRIDGVHFYGPTLLQVAQAWNSSLDDTFFKSSVPNNGSAPLSAQIACNSVSTAPNLQLSLPSTFASYNWKNSSNSTNITNLGTTNSINVGAGSVYAIAKDSLGNTFFLPEIHVPSNTPLVINGSTGFCPGGNTTLTSNYDVGNSWNNTSVTKSINVNTAGTYSVTYNGVFGCTPSTASTNVVVYPAATSVISLDGSSSLCAGQSVNLTSNTNSGNSWSTGDKTSSINVSQAGNYALTVTTQNGCQATSNVSLVVNPLPDKPTISADGPAIFCPDKSINLTSSNAVGYIWSTGATTNSINVNLAGNYTVTAKNQFGCTKTSDPFSIALLTAPAQPIITANGKTTFCDGQSVNLSTPSSNVAYNWSDGSQIQTINVKKSGNYSLKITGTNGCSSASSQAIIVSVKPVPSTPTISRVGTYTLENTSTELVGETYDWQLDGKSITMASAAIKAKASGNYTVRGLTNYVISGANILTCASAFSSPFNYQLTNNQGLSLYPNPNFSDKIAIESFDDLENIQVLIYDLKGKLASISYIPKLNEKKIIDVSFLQKGEYLLQITNGTFNVTKRILLE